MVRRNLLRSATEVNSTDALRGPLDLVLAEFMDADRFDALARSLATQHSRRATLSALLSGVLLAASQETLAERRKRSETSRGNAAGKDRRKGSGNEHGQSNDQQPTRGQTLDPTAEVASTETPELARDEVAASRDCRPAGATCRRRRQCCSKKCLRSGICACDESNPCPEPEELCKEAVCSSKGRCVIQNKAAGATCTTDNNLCTKDVCDGAGQCTHPVDPAKTGQSCENGKVCSESGCACPAGDPPCEGACLSTTGYCGQCGTRCAEGETCNGVSCQCGELAEPCKSDETCVEGACVSCPALNEICGGRCETCPDPPQPFIGPGGECCSAGISGETFCSCGTGANKCDCNGACFVRVDAAGKPEEEFCCSDKDGVVCDDGKGNVACCQNIGPESCTACGYGQLGGKIGSYRRPR
jgi:hypothetical protein